MKKLMLLLILASPIIASQKDKEKEKEEPKPLTTREIYDGSKGIGSSAAVNAGAVAVGLFCDNVTAWGLSIKASASAAAASASATVVATVTAPVVVIPAATLVGGYAGYKIYRYFRPSKKVRAEEVEYDVRRERGEEELDLTQCRKNFKNCLSKSYPFKSVTSQGYPEDCRQEAHKLAMHKGGDGEVRELATKFVTFAPIPQKKEK